MHTEFLWLAASGVMTVALYGATYLLIGRAWGFGPWDLQLKTSTQNDESLCSGTDGNRAGCR